MLATQETAGRFVVYATCNHAAPGLMHASTLQASDSIRWGGLKNATPVNSCIAPAPSALSNHSNNV